MLFCELMHDIARLSVSNYVVRVVRSKYMLKEYGRCLIFNSTKIGAVCRGFLDRVLHTDKVVESSCIQSSLLRFAT